MRYRGSLGWGAALCVLAGCGTSYGGEPTVTYELAIATRPQDVEAAQDFVIAVLGPEGRRELRAGLFGLPGP